MLTTILLALFSTSPPCWPAFAGGQTEVHWRGSKHSAETPPAELPEPARKALADWSPWAAEHGYELYLDDDGRVLFVAEDPSSKTLKLIGSTTKFFDEHLPAPEREAAAEDASAPRVAQGGAGAEPIAEDPESGGGGRSLAEALHGAPKWTSSWGAGSGQLDHDTIAILALDDGDYGSAIQSIADRNPWLGSWSDSARGNLGFVLENPLCGAWVLGNGENEEFDADAELVHRLTDLLVTRRFGRQPYWMVQGLAWFAEVELRKGVYCYPYRREFVFTAEHGAWPLDVRNRIKRECKQKSLSIGDLTALRRGSWNTEAAQLAFGSMAWMARERGPALVALLEDLREAYESGSRVDLGGGAWERNSAFEVPDAALGELCLRHFGDDFLDELTAGLKSLR